MSAKKNNKKTFAADFARTGAQRILFGPTLFTVLLLILQIAFIYFAVFIVEDYLIVLYYVTEFIGFFVIIYIVNTRSNGYNKLSWVMLILLLPSFGTVLYLIFHFQSSPKRLRTRLERSQKYARKFLHQDKQVREALGSMSPGSCGLADYAYDKTFYPAYGCDKASFFKLGDDWYEDFKKEIAGAKRFIFLEFFIVDRGQMLDELLQLLKRKVEEGVEVRLMYDGLNFLAKLPAAFPEYLESLGIKACVFMPLKPSLSSIQNNRDHNKIIVIDGEFAYTGGTNIADEYINQKVRFGHWKDTAVKISGEAVNSFTMTFLKMWNLFAEEPEDFGRYYVRHEQSTDGGFVIPYANAPIDDEEIAEYVYLDIIYRARKYLHIATPYLIINDELRTALTYAAKRGVEVCILLPHIPDKKYAFVIARSYYPELLAAGINIYEYTPGFMHAKEFICDDELCTVGTVNLDFRGLFLHFECGAFFAGAPIVACVEEDYLETLSISHKVCLEDYKRTSFVSRMLGKLLRLVGPLL